MYVFGVGFLYPKDKTLFYLGQLLWGGGGGGARAGGGGGGGGGISGTGDTVLGAGASVSFGYVHEFI